MKRQWHTVRDRSLEGSERSAELATALAQTCDPDFLEQLLHAKALFDSVGGQFFIAAVRSKYEVKTVRDDAGNILGESRRLLDDPSEPGVYETEGYIFDYGHIATSLRGAKREPDSELPAEPPESVVVKPEDLRDEIEAEVAAELEAEAEAVQATADEGFDPVAAEAEELNQEPVGSSSFEGG